LQYPQRIDILSNDETEKELDDPDMSCSILSGSTSSATINDTMSNGKYRLNLQYPQRIDILSNSSACISASVKLDHLQYPQRIDILSNRCHCSSDPAS